MQEVPSVYHRTVDYLKNAKAMVALSMGMLAINVMSGTSLEIHSDTPATKQLELALPSAFIAPQATSSDTLNYLGLVLVAGAGLETARRTTSTKGLIATGVGAQIASCGADALVDQTGLIHNEIDVGFSGITVAWLTKFMLDKSLSAETLSKKRLWKLGLGAMAVFMSAGAYVVDRHGADLDVVSHAAGIAVGALAYRLGTWRKEHMANTDKTLN